MQIQPSVSPLAPTEPIPAELVSEGRGEPLVIPDSVYRFSSLVLDRFWVAIRRLPKYLRFAASLARDGDVPLRAKAALAVGGLYTISPVDLVPGIIPVAGQLDDLIVLLLALRTAMRACPPEVAALHLERAGLTRTDFDADYAAAKDTALWLAGKGLLVSRSLASRGVRRLTAIWRGHIRPV